MTTVAQQPEAAAKQNVEKGKWQPPHYVKSLAMAIPAVFLGFQISGWVFAVFALQQGRVDFRAQYTAGYMLRSGNSSLLYDYAWQLRFQNTLISARDVTMPFDHLAYEALFFAPLSFLPFKTAYFAFLVLNVAALALSILLIRHWTSTLSYIYPWLMPVMVLVFLPTAVALMQGQESVLLLLCLILAFAALESGRDVLAGAVISLGMFKFQIVLPIALLYLFWKRWRVVLGFASSTLALVAGSLALVGRHAASSYLSLLTSMSLGLHSSADQRRLGVPPAAMPNLRGLVIGLFGNRTLGAWEQIAIGALSCVVIIAAYIAGRKAAKGSGLLIAILAAVLVSYHLLIHDMTILLLPLLVLFNQCVPAIPDGDHTKRTVAACAALLFTAPVLFCFVPSSFYLAGLAICALFYAVLRWPGYPVILRIADLQPRALETR